MILISIFCFFTFTCSGVFLHYGVATFTKVKALNTSSITASITSTGDCIYLSSLLGYYFEGHTPKPEVSLILLIPAESHDDMITFTVSVLHWAHRWGHSGFIDYYYWLCINLSCFLPLLSTCGCVVSHFLISLWCSLLNPAELLYDTDVSPLHVPAHITHQTSSINEYICRKTSFWLVWGEPGCGSAAAGLFCLPSTLWSLLLGCGWCKCCYTGLPNTIYTILYYIKHNSSALDKQNPHNRLSCVVVYNVLQYKVSFLCRGVSVWICGGRKSTFASPVWTKNWS